MAQTPRLLLKLHELFYKFPVILDKYRTRFHFLLVDEFQDTNFLQYQIIKQLTKFDGSQENVISSNAPTLVEVLQEIDNILRWL